MLTGGRRQGQEHYATLAAEHAPNIAEWIREFEENSSSIMGFGAQLREYLLTHDLAYKEEVRHSQAAVVFSAGFALRRGHFAAFWMGGSMVSHRGKLGSLADPRHAH